MNSDSKKNLKQKILRKAFETGKLLLIAHCQNSYNMKLKNNNFSEFQPIKFKLNDRNGIVKQSKPYHTKLSVSFQVIAPLYHFGCMKEFRAIM